MNAENRREFLKKAAMLSAGTGIASVLPPSIQKALAIEPAPGSSWKDAEHIVFLMQENRSFDHCFGTLQGVRGFNDPRAIQLPDGNPVWFQKNKNGETHVPFHLDIKNTRATWMGALPHSWTDQVDAFNSGKYDRWIDVKKMGDEKNKHIPMTMGYYSRKDIPFYYSLADAFTVCDQHFCSSMTGTTPNRLYFWSGKIREDVNSKARVRNEEMNSVNEANWTTYPERLEENGVSWKVYQNEISVGVGFNSEEDAWLANFTDNPLEWFSQYKVKLSKGYLDWLQKAPAVLSDKILEVEKKIETATGKTAESLTGQLKYWKNKKTELEKDSLIYTYDRYAGLSEKEKNLHNKAFTTNSKDPFYHELTSLKYKDEDGRVEELKVPKGDILFQFREDVINKKLPTVSWIVAPEKFSDHPTSPWYGAWYVSEVLDILTKDPETWKKTIFILTYDENDGYFDHVPPFVPSYPGKNSTGKCSDGIDTRDEFVSMESELKEFKEEDSRQGPIGLGFRVPMVVASPWTRGGWVNSEVFDHTSSLMFLEEFIKAKFDREIREENISAWRRAVCGNLVSVFRKNDGKPFDFPESINKEKFLAEIHNAHNKQLPEVISGVALPAQEAGIRNSCAVNYELEVDGKLSADRSVFEIDFLASDRLFGKNAKGASFNVYAPEHPDYCRFYTSAAGKNVKGEWSLKDFRDGNYHLKIYGPNGFFRELRGTTNDPEISTRLEYERSGSNKLTGNIVLILSNNSGKEQVLEIEDLSYKKGKKTIRVKSSSEVKELVKLKDSYNWYDLSVQLAGSSTFMKRYAGRVETGSHGKTDPLMGEV